MRLCANEFSLSLLAKIKFLIYFSLSHHFQLNVIPELNILKIVLLLLLDASLLDHIFRKLLPAVLHFCTLSRHYRLSFKPHPLFMLTRIWRLIKRLGWKCHELILTPFRDRIVKHRLCCLIQMSFHILTK